MQAFYGIWPKIKLHVVANIELFIFLTGEGRVDPITVKVKADRQGLGRDSALQEILRLKKKNRAEAKEKQVSVEEYQARKAEEHAERKALSELLKCQRVCWELDSKEVKILHYSL